MVGITQKPVTVGSRWKGLNLNKNLFALVVISTDAHVFYRLDGIPGISAQPLDHFLALFDPA